MNICHPHNLTKQPDDQKPYGIRLSLPAGDTFSRLLGVGWQQHHWFATREERDRAIADMASEHLYSRRGDRPTLVFETVEQSSKPGA